MGRRKLPLELIPNEKARRITYDKRKKCMMKKAQEITTLCGVDTCMIISGTAGPSAAAAAAKPEIWPTSPEKVKRIIRRYMSEGRDCRAKRMIGQPEFFANQKRKVDAEPAKTRLPNWEAKNPISEALTRELSKDDPSRVYGSLGPILDAAKARLAVVKEDAMRRSSHMNDHQGDAIDYIDDQLMLSEMMLPSYGPIVGEMSLEGTPSFLPCCGALSVMQEGPNYAGFFAGGFPVC